MPPALPLNLPPSSVDKSAPASAELFAQALAALAQPLAVSLEPLVVSAASSDSLSVTAGVPRALVTCFLYAVTGDVVAAMKTTLSGVLDSVSQVEASLGWLRKAQSDKADKGQVNAAGGGSSTSDTERVIGQLSLDVLAIGQELADAGAQNCESFVAFQECLKLLSSWRAAQ